MYYNNNYRTFLYNCFVIIHLFMLLLGHHHIAIKDRLETIFIPRFHLRHVFHQTQVVKFSCRICYKQLLPLICPHRASRHRIVLIRGKRLNSRGVEIPERHNTTRCCGGKHTYVRGAPADIAHIIKAWDMEFHQRDRCGHRELPQLDCPIY